MDPKIPNFLHFGYNKKFPELHRIRNLKKWYKEIYNKYKKKQPCKRNIHRLTFNCDVCFRDDLLIPVRNHTSIKTLITFTSTNILTEPPVVVLTRLSFVISTLSLNQVYFGNGYEDAWHSNVIVSPSHTYWSFGLTMLSGGKSVGSEK